MPTPSDTTSYLAFARRIHRALAARVAAADPEDLSELVALREDVDDTIRTAVTGIVAGGRSWAEVATALGVTKQAAWERYGAARAPRARTTRTEVAA